MLYTTQDLANENFRLLEALTVSPLAEIEKEDLTITRHFKLHITRLTHDDHTFKLRVQYAEDGNPNAVFQVEIQTTTESANALEHRAYDFYLKRAHISPTEIDHAILLKNNQHL